MDPQTSDLPAQSSPSGSNAPALRLMLGELERHAGKDLAFLTHLLNVMAQITGAQRGAAFSLSDKQDQPPKLISVYPMPADRRVSMEPAELEMLRDCVTRCREAGDVQVMRVSTGQAVWHVVAVPLTRGGKVEGAAVLLRPADDASAAGSLDHLQLLRQQYWGHVAHRMLNRHRRQMAELRGALSVLGSVREAESFPAACFNAANRLKQEADAITASVGYVRGDTVRLEAISDTEQLDRRTDKAQRLEAAMEECFDQEQPVVVPADKLTPADAWLGQAVSRCHRELIRSDSPVAVCSVPMRRGDQVVGVLTVERSTEQGFDSSSVSLLQAAADLLAADLVSRHEMDRSIWSQMRRAAARGVGKVLGPSKLGLKVAALAITALIIYSAVATWPYRVDAPFVLEAGAKRVHAASFNGFITDVRVEPGDTVQAGQMLARLDDTELRLKLSDVLGRIEETRTAQSAAMSTGENAAAKRAAARLKQLEAQRGLLQFQLDRSVMRAEEAGVVLSGRWRERDGVRVELGQELFEVAPTQGLRAMVLVDERDIEHVQVGSQGVLATRTRPHETLAFTVTRIVPRGEAFEGSNVFEVFARFEQQPDWLRPGMQGFAKIDADRQPVYWIVTHRLVNFLRLNLWW